jgi:hypothetical protein
MQNRFTRLALAGGLASVVLTIAGCPPPGKGAAAERGYRRAAPIVSALEDYRAAHGKYPEELMALVPSHLSVDTLDDFVCAGDEPARCPENVEILRRVTEAAPYHYRRSDDGYSLSFDYTGPGTNTCVFSPHTKWKCDGAY